MKLSTQAFKACKSASALMWVCEMTVFQMFQRPMFTIFTFCCLKQSQCPVLYFVNLRIDAPKKAQAERGLLNETDLNRSQNTFDHYDFWCCPRRKRQKKSSVETGQVTSESLFAQHFSFKVIKWINIRLYSAVPHAVFITHTLVTLVLVPWFILM